MAVLEAFASAEHDLHCIHPVLRNDWYDAEAIVPESYRRLARRSSEEMLRLNAQSIGTRPVSQDPSCSTVWLPRVEGDRALVVYSLRGQEAGVSGVGLRRLGGRWIVADRRRTSASHYPGDGSDLSD